MLYAREIERWKLQF